VKRSNIFLIAGLVYGALLLHHYLSLARESHWVTVPVNELAVYAAKMDTRTGTVWICPSGGDLKWIALSPEPISKPSQSGHLKPPTAPVTVSPTTTTIDPLEELLKPVQIPDEQKSKIWQSVYGKDTPDQLDDLLRKMKIDRDLKYEIWNMKRGVQKYSRIPGGEWEPIAAEIKFKEEPSFPRAPLTVDRQSVP
jgi:hypothetical protein